MRYIFLVLILFISSVAIGQTKTVTPATGNPNTIQHDRDGYFTDSVFMFRPTSGRPTYSVTQYTTAKRWPILAADTTNAILYWYNPATQSWVSGGSGGQTGDTAYLNQGFLITMINVVNPDDSFYKPNGPNIVITVDTSALIDYLNNYYTNVTNVPDSADFDYFVFSIDATPNLSYADGTEVLVAASGTTGAFVGKENWVAKLVGASYTFPYGAPVSGQQLLLSNDSDPDNTIVRAYRYNGTQWVLTAIFVVAGGQQIGAPLVIGTTDFRPVIWQTNNRDRVKIAANGDAYFNKYTGLENEPLFFKPGVNGLFDTGRFSLPVYDSPAILDSVMYIEDGQPKYGLLAGGGGSQTWESTLIQQGTTPFSAGHSVDLGGNYFRLDAASGLNNGYLVVGSDETALSVGIKTQTASVSPTYLGGYDSVAVVRISAISLTDDRDHRINTYVDSVVISSLNQTQTNLIIHNLDSSDADVNNVLWMDEFFRVHRGKVSGGGGGGTVTSFSAGNLSPLFTTSVATATTTPDLTFSLSNAGANTVFGNATGSSTAPSFGQIVNGQITNSTIDLTTKVTSTLPSGNGGTGFSTYTKGDIIYASATNTLAKLGIGTANKALTVSSSGVPQWGSYIDQDSVLVTRTGLGAFGTSTINMRNSIGFRGQNTTASTATVVQYSPVFQLEGQGWNSTDAASAPSTFSFYVAPSIASTGASSGYANGTLAIRATGPAGGTTIPFQITNGGALTTAGAIVANTGNITSSGGGLIGAFCQITNTMGAGQVVAGAASSAASTYRTTNGGSNITPGFISYQSTLAGQDFISFDNANGFVFGQHNNAGPTVRIANARIYLTDDVNTAGSESGGLGFATQTSGAVTTEKMRLTATGNLLVNTTTDVPSAKVTIASTTQGFLPPRMTATQASAISSPAEGLLVYVTDTNGTFTAKGWWGYDGAAWQKLNN